MKKIGNGYTNLLRSSIVVLKPSLRL